MHLHESRQGEKGYRQRETEENVLVVIPALFNGITRLIPTSSNLSINCLLESAFRATACQQISTRFRTKSSNYYIGIKVNDSSKKSSVA
ncbi:hypothetical protein D917_00897 [Trichinella nativa]|uniref:Uncharacterized protein n=1 Tax=Trichinella nativa TaxID=6335 RepID=A0A1Y3E3H6_9BILA|nr:hypothetical protein D917_00897 [Trichinella nativa]